MSISLTTSLQNLQISQGVEEASFISLQEEENSDDIPDFLISGAEAENFKALLEETTSSDETFCIAVPLPSDTPIALQRDHSSFPSQRTFEDAEESLDRVTSRKEDNPDLPQEAQENLLSDLLVPVVVRDSTLEASTGPMVLPKPSFVQAPFGPVSLSSIQSLEEMPAFIKAQNASLSSAGTAEETDLSLLALTLEKNLRDPVPVDIKRSPLTPEQTETHGKTNQELTTGPSKSQQEENNSFVLHGKNTPFTQDPHGPEEGVASMSPTTVFSALLSKETANPPSPTLTSTEITSVLQQVSEHFSLIKNRDENGTPFLRLQLYPEHLGTLEVQMTFREGELFLHFRGEILTMTLLQHHAQQLAQALGEQGFQLTNDQMAFSFSSSQDNPQKFFDADSLSTDDFSPGNRQEIRGPNVPAPQTPAGRVDILVATHFTKPTTQGDLAVC